MSLFPLKSAFEISMYMYLGKWLERFVSFGNPCRLYENQTTTVCKCNVYVHVDMCTFSILLFSSLSAWYLSMMAGSMLLTTCSAALFSSSISLSSSRICSSLSCFSAKMLSMLLASRSFCLWSYMVKTQWRSRVQSMESGSLLQNDSNMMKYGGVEFWDT